MKRVPNSLQKSQVYLLGEEAIGKSLLTLSIPAIIGMLINGIYNLVDTIFVGQKIGTMGIAGLAVYIPIMALIMAVCSLLGIGAGSYFSRSFGKKDLEETNHITGITIVLSLLFGSTFGIFGFFFSEPILRLFGATETILPYALPYTKMMFIGTIYFPFVVSMNNLLRAEGNSKDAMSAMLIGAIGNIVLDWFFVFYLELGLQGAAIATNIAKAFSVGYMIWYFRWSGHTMVQMKWRHFVLKASVVKEIFSVGFSSFAMNIASTITISLTNYFLGSFGGDIAIASYGLIYRILMLEVMALMGFVQGLQPLIGYNYGAKKMDRVHQAVKKTVQWTFFIGLFVMGICELFPSLVIRVFSSDPALLQYTILPLRIIMISTLFIGLQMTYTVFFQSIGLAKIAFFLSILRQLILFVPFLILFSVVFEFGVVGIWVCFPISDALSTFISVLVYRKNSKKIIPSFV
ncbi:MAG: MATE family efflux transporter [Caldisericia bacterium]|nr:MATE family efflux transporter [Caldisericia bacterium]MDD4614429.1 MATE family efflux transporter [Caldisericia bacterium]